MKIILINLFLLVGCSSNPTVKAIDEKDSTRSTIYWQQNHINTIVHAIVTEIHASQNHNFSKNKIYAFGKIENDTHQSEIETKEIANKITTILIKDGYTFVANYNEKAPKHKIDAIFKGILSSNLNQNEHQKQLFFRFNLQLLDVYKRKKLHSFQEVEVGNKSTKNLFGW